MMTMQKTNTPSNPVLAAVLVAFLWFGLKLVGVIELPWLWVLAPFWIPALLLLVVVTILVAIVVGQDLRGLD